jgi:shikimate kinase
MKRTFSDFAGARTQDPLLKREMLYQLSYKVDCLLRVQIYNLFCLSQIVLGFFFFFLSKLNFFEFMNIVLIGYMGSGKSTIGKHYANYKGLNFIDFDDYLEDKELMSVSEIFNSRGEIYFRKLESKYLKKILSNNDNSIIALGGGTPCYGNNMQIIEVDKNVKSIYLYTPVNVLSERLFELKSNRPLISHFTDESGLNDFVRKHLFERSPFYLRASFKLDLSVFNMNQIVNDLDTIYDK